MTAQESAEVRVSSFVLRALRLAYHALRERRLPLSPRRWLIDLRHLHSVMAAAPAASPPDAEAVPPVAVDMFRQVLTQTATTELLAFLSNGSRLEFQRQANPVVSVILVLFNRAELTLRCLRSLAGCSLPVEVVLVDNASNDATNKLLDRTLNAVILRQPSNLGFGEGCNAGARAARGRYILFLNNDAELLPGSLEAAVQAANGSPDIGAVGGKLIFPNGRLQEAGCIVWNDGTCLGYGRNDSPCAASYAFVRDVDFCSAAFLLTPRLLFLQLGGFDPAFSPAYYEDVDYCVRLWLAGKRVVYEPSCCVIHFEMASSTSTVNAEWMQHEKRGRFVLKHASWLGRQSSPGSTHVLEGRARRQRRVLVFDDRVPHAHIGSGFPRAAALLHEMADLGYFVTLYPLSYPDEAWDEVYSDIPRTTEVMIGDGIGRLAEFMDERRGYYDAIVVSRHHNMERLRARLGEISTWGARVIYDAEAVSALRDVGHRRVSGETLGDDVASRLIHAEVELARGTDVVLAVSDMEREAFAQSGQTHVVVARHAVRVAPTARAHHDRHGILFVGAFSPLSPNQDAVLWFLREVMPRLEILAGTRVRFTVAGHCPPREILALQSDAVSVLPNVEDLTPLYDQARLFVAPTRFAAGIPLKLLHAAAHGLPVVCTTLLARQLGWTPAVDLLCADAPDVFATACASLCADEQLWQRVRASALRRVETEYAPQVFRGALARALSETS